MGRDRRVGVDGVDDVEHSVSSKAEEGSVSKLSLQVQSAGKHGWERRSDALWQISLPLLLQGGG